MGSQRRSITDLALQVTRALPNAANTVNSNSIDLGAVTPFPVTEELVLRLSTSLSTGANNKNIVMVLQDSADNSTFANIATLATKTITANTANFAASETNYTLPQHTRRYVRVSATGEENGGNASDGNITVKLML